MSSCCKMLQELKWTKSVLDDIFLMCIVFFQDVLTITVSHNGYADPNALKFSDIKILGVSKNPLNVIIKQNGVNLPSAHNISYSTEKQVNSQFKE